jgi:cytochrome c-type biogenesis protein CcmH
MKPLALIGLIFCLLLAGAGLALAQAQDGSVTADDVNAIAKKLYCPVCENIPLDVCGTAACADWRNEIKLQLEQGMSEAEITADFVRRFGDRVVGTPQDPFLRALSLATPWLLIGLGLALALAFLLRSQRQEAAHAPAASSAPASPYHDLLERDLKG